MVPYSLLAGGALGFVRTGAGGCGMHQEPGTLGFAPWALVRVGFALDTFSTIAIVGSFSPSLNIRGLPPSCDDEQAALCRRQHVPLKCENSSSLL